MNILLSRIVKARVLISISVSGGKGLIIWHLNKSFGTYNNLGSMDVEIATAIGSNGEDWLDNGVGAGEDRGFTTDFFNSSRPTFAPWTNPSTETGYKYSDSHSFTDLSILNISATGANMDFDFVENSPPGAPQNLAITNAGQNGQNVILSWSANTEPDLDHYAIYRGYQSGAGPIFWGGVVATTSNTNWTDTSFEINTSSSDKVHYRITAVDDADNESDYSNTVNSGTDDIPIPKKGTETLALPKEIALHPNYPNPFNPETQIQFELPESAHVTLKIYNILGEEVRTLSDGDFEANFHAIKWNAKDDSGTDLSSGLYIYTIKVVPRSGKPTFTQTRKMTLLR